LKGRFRKAAVLAAALTLAVSATAYGVSATIGPLFVSTTATMQPRELPKRGGAPITLSTITRVGTRDGSTPPKLSTIEFLIDKHGSVNSRAFPVCRTAQLEGTTTKQARQRCAGALVGRGRGTARVTLPDQEPFEITYPVSFFNAPPSGGRPTMIVHAREAVPTPKTLLSTIVVERVAKGRYGYRVRFEMPEIAGGAGVPVFAEAKIGATRKRDGKKVGYLSATCVGGRLQVEGNLSFTNGDFFPATLTSPCHSPS
jgi:hypothetical protein